MKYPHQPHYNIGTAVILWSCIFHVAKGWIVHVSGLQGFIPRNIIHTMYVLSRAPTKYNILHAMAGISLRLACRWITMQSQPGTHDEMKTPALLTS